MHLHIPTSTAHHLAVTDLGIRPSTSTITPRRILGFQVEPMVRSRKSTKAWSRWLLHIVIRCLRDKCDVVVAYGTVGTWGVSSKATYLEGLLLRVLQRNQLSHAKLPNQPMARQRLQSHHSGGPLERQG